MTRDVRFRLLLCVVLASVSYGCSATTSPPGGPPNAARSGNADLTPPDLEARSEPNDRDQESAPASLLAPADALLADGNFDLARVLYEGALSRERSERALVGLALTILRADHKSSSRTAARALLEESLESFPGGSQRFLAQTLLDLIGRLDELDRRLRRIEQQLKALREIDLEAPSDPP